LELLSEVSEESGWFPWSASGRGLGGGRGCAADGASGISSGFFWSCARKAPGRSKLSPKISNAPVLVAIVVKPGTFMSIVFIRPLSPASCLALPSAFITIKMHDSTLPAHLTAKGLYRID